jgi:hypothetical protein
MGAVGMCMIRSVGHTCKSWIDGYSLACCNCGTGELSSRRIREETAEVSILKYMPHCPSVSLSVSVVFCAVRFAKCSLLSCRRQSPDTHTQIRHTAIDHTSNHTRERPTFATAVVERGHNRSWRMTQQVPLHSAMLQTISR